MRARKTPPPSPGRWSRRRTLVFVLTVCGLFWAVVAAGVWLAVRR